MMNVVLTLVEVRFSGFNEEKGKAVILNSEICKIKPSANLEGQTVP